MARVSHETIRQHATENPHLTNVEVGVHLGVSEAAVRRAFQGHHRPRLEHRVEIEKPVRLGLEHGDIALAGDLHVPLTNWRFLNRFLADMKAEKVKTLGIPGDFWNADQASEFDYKQKAAGMADEKRIGTEVMTAMLETFDRVVFSWGNHDARYHKLLRYGLSFTETMRMLFCDVPDRLLERVTFTNLDHFWIDDGRFNDTPWYVCHPKSYSSIPLTQARRLAAKHLCNVVTAHSHHHAVGHDVSGRFVCAEVGGFFDASVTEYLQRSTHFSNWQNGYAVVRADNTLEMRSDRWVRR